MRVAIVAPEFSSSGGMQVHAVEIARHLARNHDVLLLTAATANHLDASPGVVLERVLQRQYWLSTARIVSSLRRFRPDAVHALNAGYAALGRLTRYPVVTRVVGNDFYSSWIGPHLPLRFLFWRLPSATPGSPGRLVRDADQRLRNRFVAWGLDGSEVILANSTFTRDALTRAGVRRARIEVMLGGVDLEAFHPGEREEARARLSLPPGPIVTTLAHLKPKKGIDTALEAVRLLVATHPDLTYLVIGTGAALHALEAQARDLGIAERVRFLGKKPHRELRDYLVASDVYLQGSKTAIDPITRSLDVETMGRAACEASACGIPVIATRSGGLLDVVRHQETGLLIPEADPDSLAEALTSLLGDRALRDRLGRQGLAHARAHYGWDTVAARTERALADAVACTTEARGRLQ